MTKKSFDRHRFFRIVTWLWLIILTSLMLMPGKDIPAIELDLPVPMDKLVHFISLFVAASCFLLSIRWEQSKHRFKIIFGLLFYAIGIEFIQSIFQKSRAFEMADIAANLLGVASALILYLLVGKFVKN